MKALVNKTNTVPAGGDYPYGDIKDNPGDNSGTPVDRNLIGDIHRNVMKIMDAAGVVPNNLDDNEANGYQIFEAIRKVARPYKVISGLLKSTAFTIFENTSGETITWSSPFSDVYRLAITNNAFVTGKVAILIQPFAVSIPLLTTPTVLIPIINADTSVDFYSLKPIISVDQILHQESSTFPASGVFVEIRIYD